MNKVTLFYIKVTMHVCMYGPIHVKAGLHPEKFSSDKKFFFVLHVSFHGQLVSSRQKKFSCPKKIFLSVNGPLRLYCSLKTDSIYVCMSKTLNKRASKIF